MQGCLPFTYKAFRHEENLFIQRFYLFIQGLYLLYKDRYWLYNNTNLRWLNKKPWMNTFLGKSKYSIQHQPRQWEKEREVFFGGEIPLEVLILKALRGVRNGKLNQKENYILNLNISNLNFRLQPTHIKACRHLATFDPGTTYRHKCDLLVSFISHTQCGIKLTRRSHLHL